MLPLHGTPPPSRSPHPLGSGKVPFRGGHRGLHCNPSPASSSVGRYEGLVRNSPMYIFISPGVFVVAFACSQCIMGACLFLKSLERVPFQFTVASVVVSIYFPRCCKGHFFFFFSFFFLFTKECPWQTGLTPFPPFPLPPFPFLALLASPALPPLPIPWCLSACGRIPTRRWPWRPLPAAGPCARRWDTPSRRYDIFARPWPATGRFAG